MGFSGKMPKLVACGGRRDAFDGFKAAHETKASDFVAMIVDSEYPVADIEATWNHVAEYDNWHRPKGAQDDQILFMVTCMETWIVADRDALIRFYDDRLLVRRLPSFRDLERQSRTKIQECLKRATEKCRDPYRKGKHSFKVLEILDSEVLEKRLPSFERTRRIFRSRFAG